MPVVGSLDPNGGEDLRERVDLAEEVLRREPTLPQLFGQRVRRRRDGHPPLDQRRQQSGDQRRIAGIVELELVDAHHHVLGEQLDALHEAEHPRQLRQLAERRERGGAGVGRATARSTSTPTGGSCRRRSHRRDTPRHRGAPRACRTSSSCPPGVARPARRTSRHACTAAVCDGSARVGPVRVEADVGEGGWRHQTRRSTAPASPSDDDRSDDRHRLRWPQAWYELYPRAAMVNVSDPDAATELTELAPSADGFDTDDDRLAAFYSYPDDSIAAGCEQT